jgi:hypothetical protein
MLKQDRIEDYLKGLNVYNEIVGIKSLVEKRQFDLEGLVKLSGEATKSRL